jgi:hypothetical protein
MRIRDGKNSGPGQGMEKMSEPGSGINIRIRNIGSDYRLALVVRGKMRIILDVMYQIVRQRNTTYSYMF